MRRLIMIVVTLLVMGSVESQALTVQEIIALKQAGVSDETIQLMLRQQGDARSAGTWRTEDGWRVHTTETRIEDRSRDRECQSAFPIVVYPEVNLGRKR